MQALSVTKTNVLSLLDVRSKMLIAATSAIMTISLSSLNAQILMFTVSFVYLVLLGRYRLIAVSYTLVLIMMLLSVGFTALVALMFPSLGKNLEITALSVPFLRAFTMMNTILPMAFTGKLQNILRSLQQMKLPFIIYLPAAVIVRFIPTFAGDVKQIWESLKIRGYKVNPWTFTRHPVRTTRLLFAPLLFRALKTSDELGIAAELKGLHSGSVPGNRYQKSFSRSDVVTLVILATVCIAAVLLQIYFPSEVKAVMK